MIKSITIEDRKPSNPWRPYAPAGWWVAHYDIHYNLSNGKTIVLEARPPGDICQIHKRVLAIMDDLNMAFRTLAHYEVAMGGRIWSPSRTAASNSKYDKFIESLLEI